ncbi:MAG: substrate-binding domain-containing protein [Bacillota bacterium]
MKRSQIISIALVIVLIAFAIAGCAAKEPAAPEATNEPAQETKTQEATNEKPAQEETKEVDLSKFKVGFAQDTLNQPWRNYQAECVKKVFAEYGINCEVTDGQGKAEKQISNIEDMVANGLDLLVVSPAQEAALTPVVEQVYQKGIPVVCIDRGIKSDAYTTFVHADNILIGAMAADFIAEKMTEKYGEPKGNVVVIEGVPGSTTAVQRDEGFRKRIQEKYPNLKILASQPADYRRDLAMAVMEDYLQAYDNIDAVFTHADEMTMGAIAAIENAGRRNEMIIASVNGTMEAIKAIMDGRMDCSVLYSNCSGPGVEYAVKLLKGEEVPKNVVIEALVIDTENAAEYYKEGAYSPDPMPLEEGKYTIIK